MNFASNVFIKGGVLLLALGFAGCQAGSHDKAAHQHKGDFKHQHNVAQVESKDSEGPKKVTLIKMLSWPEPTISNCEADIEGRKPPARFTLKYTNGEGKKTVINNDADALMNNGWEFIHRTTRGYGFEKQGEFSRFDFEMIEELQCSCGSGDEKKQNVAPIEIRFLWESGSPLQVTGSIGAGKEKKVVEPVVISGLGAVYEFTFSQPLPGKKGKTCSSKFFALLNLSEPLE